MRNFGGEFFSGDLIGGFFGGGFFGGFIEGSFIVRSRVSLDGSFLFFESCGALREEASGILCRLGRWRRMHCRLHDCRRRTSQAISARSAGFTDISVSLAVLSASWGWTVETGL